MTGGESAWETLKRRRRTKLVKGGLKEGTRPESTYGLINK